MIVLKALLVSITVVFFQAVAARLYTFHGTTPHFVLLAVSFVALNGTTREALLTAIVAGALLDTFSLDAWGVNIAALLLAAYVLERATAAGWSERPAPRALLLALAILLALASRFLLLGFVSGSLPSPAGQLAVAVYSWALALPLFALLEPIRPFLVRISGHWSAVVLFRLFFGRYL